MQAFVLDPLKASQGVTRSSSLLVKLQTGKQEVPPAPGPSSHTGISSGSGPLSSSATPGRSSGPSGRAGAKCRATRPHGHRPCSFSLRRYRRERNAASRPPAAASPPAPGEGNGGTARWPGRSERRRPALPPCPGGSRMDGERRSRLPRPKKPLSSGPLPSAGAPICFPPPAPRLSRRLSRAANKAPQRVPRYRTALPASLFAPHRQSTPLQHLELGLAESASGPWNMVADDGLSCTAPRTTAPPRLSGPQVAPAGPPCPTVGWPTCPSCLAAYRMQPALCTSRLSREPRRGRLDKTRDVIHPGRLPLVKPNVRQKERRNHWLRGAAGQGAGGYLKDHVGQEGRGARSGSCPVFLGCIKHDGLNAASTI